MGALGIEVRGGYSFRNYAGDKENAMEFINQFKPYKEKWSNDETWAHIENCLRGKALNWFRDAKGKFFNTWEEFVVEFSEMFCEKESSEVTNLLRKIRSLKIKEGNLEEIMLEFFAIDQGSIALKDIVEMISYELPTHYANS